MYYKVYTWLVTQLVVSIHPSMGRHFTLTGTINTSAECPGGHSPKKHREELIQELEARASLKKEPAVLQE